MASSKTTNNQLKALVGVLITLNTILLGTVNKPSPTIDDTNTMKVNVVDVIDGDTFVTKDNYRVRLHRVDAPELGMCMADEAKKQLSQMVLDKTVLLTDVMPSQYGRILAGVYSDDVFVNGEMLRLGLARFAGGKGEIEDKMRIEADKARQNQVGIFEKCVFYENKQNSKCSIKGNIDKNSGTKIYHFDGCSGYEGVAVEYDLGEGWFCSEKEALKAGYVKSKQCFGKVF